MSDPSSSSQKSKYAAQLAYEKRKLATDPEFRKKKQERSANSTKKRYQTDEAFRHRILEYQKKRRDALKESHKALQELLKFQNDEQYIEVLQKLANNCLACNCLK